MGIKPPWNAPRWQNLILLANPMISLNTATHRQYCNFQRYLQYVSNLLMTIVERYLRMLAVVSECLCKHHLWDGLPNT